MWYELTRRGVLPYSNFLKNVILSDTMSFNHPKYKTQNENCGVVKRKTKIYRKGFLTLLCGKYFPLIIFCNKVPLLHSQGKNVISAVILFFLFKD